MEIFLLISIVFFYVAYGAINNYKKEFFINHEAIPQAGNYTYLLIGISCFIFPVICYVKYLGIAWYWCIPLNFIACNFLGGLLFSIYCSFFGFKGKPKFSLRQTGYVRQNLFIVDAFVSFGIAIITLILGLI